MKNRLIISAFLILFCIHASAQPTRRNIRTEEYRNLQEKLCRGWNTWYNNNLTSYTYLPEGFTISFRFATDDNKNILQDILKVSDYNSRPEKVFPGLRSDDGSYTSLRLNYGGMSLKIETAAVEDDFFALITPEKPYSHSLIVEVGSVYEKDGLVGKKQDCLFGEYGDKKWSVRVIGKVQNKAYAISTSPRTNILLDGKVAVYTGGSARTIEEIEQVIDKAYKTQQQRADSYGELAESFLSMQTILAWNTIYDPCNKRAITPVSRLWNRNWGGYVLFDWDSYFASYMMSLYNKDLAYASAVEITKAITPDGFIPNFQSVSGYIKDGNTSSWDRSQPPVGSMMVWEVFNRFREKWFLEEVYDELLEWNRWWAKNRENKGHLAWGSYFLKDGHKYSEGIQGAKFESGLDNSPMYDGVPFDTITHTMMLADVGLESMYIMDCKALAKIASELGKKDDARELSSRAKNYSKKLATLWDEESGIFLNKRLDTEELSHVISPTNFYSLISGVPTEKQARRMIDEHYFNPEEFHGEFIIPSIARNAKGFTDNNYFRGRIWAPMNFLVYFGMQNYDLKDARMDLIRKSKNLLMKNWKENGGIFENYNSVNGRGDDVINADGFYHWGALLTFIEFIENGYLTPELESK